MERDGDLLAATRQRARCVAAERMEARTLKPAASVVPCSSRAASFASPVLPRSRTLPVLYHVVSGGDDMSPVVARRSYALRCYQCQRS